MADHDAVAALPWAAGISSDKHLLREMLIARMPYVLKDSEDPQEFLETDSQSGAVVQDILFGGRVFHLDPDDALTPHDGVTCLVTDGGQRYKLAEGSDVIAYSVLDFADEDPSLPSLGDAYLVEDAATGEFAGHDGEVAVYTARGWEFVDFGIGRLLYVEAEDVFYRRKPDNSWAKGFGASALSDGTVAPSAMIGGGGKLHWIVENQTTNSPPSVVDGNAYIIGSSPTGAWSGHAGKIAHGENGQWVIYTPAEGWIAYDKATDGPYRFTGAAWQTASGELRRTDRAYFSSSTWNKPARLAYVVVHVIGGGANGSTGAAGTNGSTSSFGAHCSATGGSGGSNGGGGAGGAASGGDLNIPGRSGMFASAQPDTVTAMGGLSAGPLPGFGQGGAVFGSAGGGGGAGGYARKIIQAAALAASETVTIGTAAQNNGYVIVEEYTYA